MPSLLGRPSEPCLLRQSGYSTVSHYALVAMMPTTRNLLPQAISSSSPMGCLCHQEPSKMRTCFPASSGEGDKSSQTTSGPDGCTSTYPCSGAKEVDPQTTQPGSQWSGSCCNRECPTWPLTARPSHKSISSPGWFGSYSQSRQRVLHCCARFPSCAFWRSQSNNEHCEWLSTSELWTVSRTVLI